jgi:RNA polymerase sigma-70 factor (ECF subfamily)
MEAAAAEAEIPDRRLALLFACAHPAIDAAVRAPLMLQTVVGLDAKQIASAFLVSPAAMGKRLVRAKDKIREAGIPFRVPESEELPGRLGAVLEAVYAAFAEGWSDAGGTDVVRRDLTEESLLPGPAGGRAASRPSRKRWVLLALVLHAEARRGARRDAHGEYVPFAEQDLARWDWPMIAEAEGALGRASTLGVVGRYQLEAALQSAHVHRRHTGQANWDAVVQIYDALAAITGSPVVAVNRALAVAEIQGPGRAWPRSKTSARTRAWPSTSPTGRARRPAGARGRTRRGPPRLRPGHRPRARPRRAPFPAAAPIVPAHLICHLAAPADSLYGGHS